MGKKKEASHCRCNTDNRSVRRGDATLSPMELAVLRLSAQGYSQTDIAVQLAIKGRSVRTLRQNVKTQLGLHPDAVLFDVITEGRRQGFLPQK